MFPAANLNYFMQYVTTEGNPNSNYEFSMQKNVSTPQSRRSYSILASLTQNILNIITYKHILHTSGLTVLSIHNVQKNSVFRTFRSKVLLKILQRWQKEIAVQYVTGNFHGKFGSNPCIFYSSTKSQIYSPEAIHICFDSTCQFRGGKGAVTQRNRAVWSSSS
jgi:hypothetical protein